MSTLLLSRKLFSMQVAKNAARFNSRDASAKAEKQTTSFLSILLKAFSTWSA